MRIQFSSPVTTEGVAPKKKKEELIDSQSDVIQDEPWILSGISPENQRVQWDKKRLDDILRGKADANLDDRTKAAKIRTETSLEKTLRIRNSKHYQQFFNLPFIQTIILEAQAGNIQPQYQEILPQNTLEKITAKLGKESKLSRFFKSPECILFLWSYKDGRLLNASEVQKQNGKYITLEIHDADILPSMLNAANSVVAEGLKIQYASKFKEQTDENLTIGTFTGENSCLAAIYNNRGSKIWGLEKGMEKIVEDLEEAYKAHLEKWNGNVDPFKGCEERLCDELVKIQRKSRRKKIVTALTPAILLGGLFGGLAYELSKEKPIPPVPYVPHAPEISDIPDINVTAGDPLDIYVPAFDADGDILEYNLSFANGTFLPIDNITGRLHISEVPESWIGNHSLKAMVKELTRYNFNVSKLFNLTVKEKLLPILNEKPFITSLNVEKVSPYLKFDASANDTDNTKIGGLEFYIDNDFYKRAESSYFNDTIDLKIKRLAAGLHMLRVRAIDALDAGLYSNWTEKSFDISDAPKITKVSVQNDGTDNPAVNVEAYSESTSNIVSLHADVHGTNVTGDKNLTASGNEISDSVSIDLNGLKIKGYDVYVSAKNENNVTSESARTNVTPYDDPAKAGFELGMSGEDQLILKLTASDEEGQIVKAAYLSNTPTKISKSQDFNKVDAIEITEKIDLSKDRAGDFKIDGDVTLADGTSVNATAHIKIVDNSPVIYAWSINPATESNDFIVSVAGHDNDTIEVKFVLDVKGAANEQKEVPINSKNFNFTIPLNYAANEPGAISLSGKLIPNANETSPEAVVFENVSRIILNEKPIILQNTFVDYNPLNKTVSLAGKVTDVDSKIVKGTYELINLITGQNTTGFLDLGGGTPDGRSKDFNRTFDLSGTGLPEGMYNLTVALKDAQGLEDKITIPLQINNTVKVIPVWNDDVNATGSNLTWDPIKKVAYLQLLGNNTLEQEKNDFELLATPALRDYVKANWTNHVIPDDVSLSIKNLHQDVIMNYSAGAPVNASGYVDDTILGIDSRTTYEWIKDQILKNESIPQATKDKWARFFAFTINYQNKFPMCFYIYDANADGQIQDTEKWVTYQSKTLAPSQYNPINRHITEYNTFKLWYGAPAALVAANQALLDTVDLENRAGGNWTDINKYFDASEENTLNHTMQLIKYHDINPKDNRTELREIGWTIYSLPGLKEQNIFDNRVVKIRYNDQTQEYDCTLTPI